MIIDFLGFSHMKQVLELHLVSRNQHVFYRIFSLSLSHIKQYLEFHLVSRNLGRKRLSQLDFPTIHD